MRLWHSQTDKNDMDKYNNVSYISGDNIVYKKYNNTLYM